MVNYSFIDHVTTLLNEFITKYGFSLNKSASQIFPGFQDNLSLVESQQCRIQISLEHYRVYMGISASDVKDVNLWYGIDVMACFVSKTPPSIWIYDLPRKTPLSQVMEQQLMRWGEILDNYFDMIVLLFDSKDVLYKIQKTLDKFVMNYYSEHRNYLKNSFLNTDS